MKRFILATWLLAATSVPSFANIAIPRETWTDISMVSEHVKIVLGREKITVEASFELKNTGEAVTAVVGYPRGMLEKSLDVFSVTVDDEAVEVKSQSAGRDVAPVPLADEDAPARKRYQFEGDYPEWKLFHVRFDAGQTRQVVVRYHVTPGEVKTADGETLLAYIYTLRTGATWKGNIEKSVIEVTLEDISPADLATVTPEKHETKGATLTWTFKDFKPTQDIELTFREAEGTDD